MNVHPTGMYIYLSKILPLMVLPIGLAIEFIVLGLLLLWWGRRKSAVFFMLLSVVVLWAFSTPIVADRLLGSLENQFPPVATTAVPQAQCIVLLGGFN